MWRLAVLHVQSACDREGVTTTVPSASSPATAPLSPTERSTVQRGKERARTERDDLYAVLDAGLVCHLGVIINGAPLVLPTCYGRDGDMLYLHGSTGAATLRTAMASPVCVSVTLLDGIVYGRSVFHHSVNYRSAVVHGRARILDDPDEKTHGLRVFTEHVAPGSWDHARLPNRKEMAATALLALDLTEASVKMRSGPPIDEDYDVADDVAWAGVLPLRSTWGAPEPCPQVGPKHATVPGHVADRAAPA